MHFCHANNALVEMKKYGEFYGLKLFVTNLPLSQSVPVESTHRHRLAIL